METIPSTTKSRNLAANLGLSIGIILAVALFVIIVGRMGFLPFGGGDDTAVAGSIALTAQDFKFAQTELHVKVGETVTVRLNNSDRLPHSFDLDEFNVHVPMPGNENVTATFTPVEPGTYTFYCDIPGHRELGMAGTLVVAP